VEIDELFQIFENLENKQQRVTSSLSASASSSPPVAKVNASSASANGWNKGFLSSSTAGKGPGKGKIQTIPIPLPLPAEKQPSSLSSSSGASNLSEKKNDAIREESHAIAPSQDKVKDFVKSANMVEDPLEKSQANQQQPHRPQQLPQSSTTVKKKPFSGIIQEKFP
jgi:hypothetical protein